MNIRYKLFLAILLTALFSVIALQQAQRYSFESGLKRHSLNNRLERLDPLVLGLIDIYVKETSWESLRGQPRLPIPRILLRSDERFNRPRPPHRSKKFEDRLKVGRRPKLYRGLALLDKDKQYIAGAIDTSSEITKSITYEDNVIGYLAVPSNSNVNSDIDRRFSEQQKVGRIWAIVAILIGALLSALLISRSLSRPIRHLVERVQELSDGHYHVDATDKKNNEFGSLSKNLNSLALRLDEDRTNRQQWISDISHELRTPVAILQAEIECIEDGHKPLDESALSSLKSEVSRLSYLIDDLHQMSLADSGAMSFNFSFFHIADEIDSAMLSAQERFAEKEISFDVELDGIPTVYGDIFRIRQVISNLIQNSIRYTDTSGCFRISWQKIDDAVELIFEDSAPSVPAESLPKLFNRLYRVDPSRNRVTGASGLGLSICHAIIKAHGGFISAEKSVIGGLAIRFSLPLNPPKLTQT